TAQNHPGVRIVTLSSVAHVLITPDVKVDSLQSLNNDFGEGDGTEANLKRYGYSKLANILFAKELQHKLDEAGIQAISVAVHPGGVKTGALAPLFVAAAEEVWEERSKWAAAYIMPYGVPSPEDESEAAKDSKLAKELWETTEDVLTENVGISVKF
ncbi:hypothetical protein F5877DRAFT_52061, partial [Lentinula edodes]